MGNYLVLINIYLLIYWTVNRKADKKNGPREQG